jgi:Family of unknown function (DUF6459)
MSTSQAVRSGAADDLSAICLLALPELGPPFDDDPVAARTVADAVASPQGAPGPATPPLARTGVVATGPDADRDWAGQFARLLTEALSGARPVRQIVACTSERARIQLQALMPLFGGGQRPRLLRVIATRPTRDVIEMTVIAGIGARTRALAVRLQRADPAERPAWLNPAESGKQREVPALSVRAARTGRGAAPRWLCTDIEAA